MATLSFGNSVTVVDAPWSDFSAYVAAKRLVMQFVDDAGLYRLFAFDTAALAYTCIIHKGAVPQGDDQTQNDTDKAAFEAIKSTLNQPIAKRDVFNAPIQTTSLRAGNKAQFVSQNFCDKHTWYSTSVRHTAQAMTDNGAGTVWSLATNAVGVDVTHGRLLGERRLRSTYQPVVKVNGVTKTEKDPHDDAGDYSIDYATMQVTFASTQAGNTVTMDFSEVINSKWYLKPTEGKRLRLVSAELQFSTDARMEDTFVFQPRGDVSKFELIMGYWNGNGGPYPAGTMLPLGPPTCYQTVFDLICEANLAYPLVPKLQHDVPTWRDTLSDILIFSWDYGEQAVIDISSGRGLDVNDIEICLEHDVEMAGTCAVVTFYCLSEDL